MTDRSGLKEKRENFNLKILYSNYKKLLHVF